MIRLENVTKQFASTVALKDVSITLASGKCTGLIGPNACGKTTLIKCILSMVIPTKGRIYFDNKNIKGEVDYKKRIGYMPQIGRYPENMNIGQVMDMIRNIRKYEGEEDLDLWDAFRLEGMKDKKMGTLSGGTTQKVSAALAFMCRPEVLILDEPTAGLDPISSEILRDKIISERKNGKLILITSHVLSELDEMITDIVFMQEADIMFYKPIQELYETTGEERVSRAIAKILKERVA